MFTPLLNQLTDITHCNEILEDAYLEQKSLLWKKLGLELQIERRQRAMKATTAKLQSKKEERDYNRNVAIGLGETHPGQKGYLNTVTRAEYELAMLEDRSMKQEPKWLVEKALQLNCIAAGLEELSLRILELEAHKVGLQKQAAAEAVPAEVPAAAGEDHAEPGLVEPPVVSDPPLASHQQSAVLPRLRSYMHQGWDGHLRRSSRDPALSGAGYQQHQVNKAQGAGNLCNREQRTGIEAAARR